ncbi:metallophosphoesterase [Bacillus horti]|uniref:Serine/threonine protein phosphatase 1 n=1 Tax=Caldalkalibacillus horti TaxID=77523 RepID=A0ABT9VXW9_9BACI|nr:metallophosphoesterase [Bacillus horti]MDQ0165831.1 serine/threonine protein phosphatase 1 [Bacillus horti]
MNRRLVISDIHGHGESLLELLTTAQYSPEQDQLVLLGDYIHKGPDSLGTLEIVYSLKQQGAWVIRGNHEQDVLDHKRNQLAAPLTERMRQFLLQMPLWKADDQYIYAHAGVRAGVELQNQSITDLTTIRDEFFHSNFPIRGKQIVFGHTLTSRIGAKFGHILWKDDRIGIDTGAGKRLFLSLVDLTNKISYRKRITTGEIDIIHY